MFQSQASTSRSALRHFVAKVSDALRDLLLCDHLWRRRWPHPLAGGGIADARAVLPGYTCLSKVLPGPSGTNRQVLNHFDSRPSGVVRNLLQDFEYFQLFWAPSKIRGVLCILQMSQTPTATATEGLAAGLNGQILLKPCLSI